MSKLNYFIVAPPWSENCGGVVALNILADNLAVLGEKAYVCATSRPVDKHHAKDGGIYPQSKATLVSHGWSFHTRPEEDCYIPSITRDNSAFIYCEPFEMLENRYDAKNVVRWFIFHNWNHLVPPKEEMIYGWMPDFDMAGLKPLGYMQTIKSFPEKFYNAGLPRKGECVLIKKECMKKLDQHHSGAINIDLAPDNEYLFNIFNTTERFICYDHNSFLPVQAAMCGCLPVVIANPMLKNRRVFNYGIAFGFDDKQMSWARATMPFVRRHMQNVEAEGLRETKKFAEICEERFSLSCGSGLESTKLDESVQLR